MATRYVRLLIAAVLLSTTLWLLVNLSGPAPPPQPKIAEIPKSEPVPEGYAEIHTNLTQEGEGTQLKHHGIANIRMGADVGTLRLHANFTESVPPLYQEIDARLTRFAKADSEDLGLAPYTWPTSVQVQQQGPRSDASMFVFGIASTLIRLNDAIPAMSHWAAGTKAKIVVIINPKDDKGVFTVAGTRDRANDLDIELEIVEEAQGYVERFTILLKVLHQFSTPDTQWAGLLDDDTFFPSMARLQKMLVRYNPKEPHYIGGLTEDLDAISKWGYMAFGGAGIFLSRTLLDKLQAHMDDCEKLPIISPDARVAECIYKYTTTKFTWEKQLIQFDMYGDYSGVFEAVRPLPISVHHWKSWGSHDMLMISKVAKICGDACIFQKFQLADGWFLTNGFSIVKFSEAGKDAPGRLDGKKSDVLLHQDGSMERTWKKVGEESPTKYLHSLSPLRPKDEGKRTYMLENVVEEDSKLITFYYVKRDGDQAESIIRLIWSRD